jgi:hypothetical protein
MKKNKKLKAAYKLVIKNLKTACGKKCKSYAVGCYVCICHRMAEDLESISKALMEE